MPPKSVVCVDLTEDHDSLRSPSSEASFKPTKSRSDLEYYKEFFLNPKTTIDSSGQRKKRTHSGYCKLCVCEKHPLGKELYGKDSYYQFAYHVNTCHNGRDEYKVFLSAADQDSTSSGKRQRCQQTLDGVVKKTADAYSLFEPLQVRLVDNVAKCCLESLIPMNALAHGSFDELIQDIDPRLREYLKDPGDLKTYAEELLHELNERLGSTESDNLFMVATFLDPKRKLKWCNHSDDANKPQTVRDLVLKLMCEIHPSETPSAVVVRQEPQEKQPGFLDFMDDEDTAPSSSSVSEPSAETELSQYLDDKDSAQNPLEYWFLHRCHFKRLYKLSRLVLCAPASTAGVERLFSIAGIILSNRRLSTTDENFESLLFTHVNKGLYESVTKNGE